MNVETRTSQGVDHPVKYALAADHDDHDWATAIAETYLDTIVDSIVNQPRSLQRTIGPSEIGKECDRALLHKLNGDEEPARPDIPWAPTIGTSVHDYLERAFDQASTPQGREPGRWLTEERVEVGTIGRQVITGSTDLYDTWGKAVIDHKIIGASSRKKYRAHGPSHQYRVQAHTYGKGWEDDGFPVRLVMIAFLPREGQLSDSFIWSEPYDRSIAEDALARVNRLETLRATVGIDAALALYSECDDRWCPWCGTQSSFPKMQTLPSPEPATPSQTPATPPAFAVPNK